MDETPEKEALLDYIKLLKEKLASVSSDEDKSSLKCYLGLAEQTLSELDSGNSLSDYLNLFEKLEGNTWLSSKEDFEQIRASWYHFKSLLPEVIEKYKRFQFSILDIMIWTTFVAVFFAIATQAPVLVQVFLILYGFLIFTIVGMRTRKYWPLGLCS